MPPIRVIEYRIAWRAVSSVGPAFPALRSNDPAVLRTACTVPGATTSFVGEEVLNTRRGDTVWTPRGQEHWHGATEGNMIGVASAREKTIHKGEQKS